MIRYRRSAFLLVKWDADGKLVLVNANTFRHYRASDLHLSVLHELSEPRTAREVAEALDKPSVQPIEMLLRHLLAAGVVLEETDPPDQTPALGNWTVLELAVQRQAAFGQVRDPLPETPPPPPLKDMAGHPTIRLPRPRQKGGQGFYHVLEARRSSRTYSGAPLSVSELSSFLHAAARVKSMRGANGDELTYRPYPGSGARHTLELYLLSHDVKGVERGAYYYHPLEHALYRLRGADQRYHDNFEMAWHAAAGRLNARPAILLLIMSRVDRMMWKYERLGLVNIYRDVGCLVQTMYLVATEMGLAPCAIGTIRDRDNAEWLDLNPLDEAQVGCFLLGK